MKNYYWKAQDHCHYTGKHRGATHLACNLRYENKNAIPVVFHNASNYYHSNTKELARDLKEILNPLERILKNI